MAKRKPNEGDDMPLPIVIPTTLDIPHAQDLAALWREYPPARIMNANKGVFEYDSSSFLLGAHELGITQEEIGQFLALTRVHVELGSWGTSSRARNDRKPAPKCIK